MKDSLNKMMTDFDALTGHRWFFSFKSRIRGAKRNPSKWHKAKTWSVKPAVSV